MLSQRVASVALVFNVDVLARANKCLPWWARAESQAHATRGTNHAKLWLYKAHLDSYFTKRVHTHLYVGQINPSLTGITMVSTGQSSTGYETDM